MNTNNRLLLAGMLFSLFLSSAHGQSPGHYVVAAAGGQFTTANGSLSWTLGEAVTETHAHDGGILTHGFHQPPVVRITSVGTSEDHALAFYPNPVKDVLVLEGMRKGNYYIQLFSSRGETLIAEQMDVMTTPRQHRIDMRAFASALYLLRITNIATRKVHAAKIEKQ